MSVETFYCSCGGEMQLDSFYHPRRTEEWFFRCRICSATSTSASSPKEAEEVFLNGVSDVIELPTPATTMDNQESADGFADFALD